MFVLWKRQFKAIPLVNRTPFRRKEVTFETLYAYPVVKIRMTTTKQTMREQ